MVTHQVFTLWSDEWYLFTPLTGTHIYGDKIIIEKGTDFDSMIIEWGKIVASGVAR